MTVSTINVLGENKCNDKKYVNRYCIVAIIIILNDCVIWQFKDCVNKGTFIKGKKDYRMLHSNNIVSDAGQFSNLLSTPIVSACILDIAIVFIVQSGAKKK